MTQTPPTHSRTDPTVETVDQSPEATYRDEAWMRDKYLRKEQTMADIADTTGVAPATISRWMLKHGIETRSPGDPIAESDRNPLTDESWLRQQYVDNERSQTTIATEVGVSQPTVRKYLDRYGIDTRSIAEAVADGTIEPLTDESWLRQQYVTERKTQAEIAEELGVSPPTIGNYLDRNGIETR